MLADPPERTTRDKVEAPVTGVLRNFMVEDGKRLELMTRANPTLARAAQIGFIFANMIKTDDGATGSAYVSGRIEQIERLAVSLSGLGRQDQIAALQAGGRLPDAYYEKSGAGAQFEIKE